MRVAPTILVALHCLSTQANLAEDSPPTVDLLTWLQDSEPDEAWKGLTQGKQDDGNFGQMGPDIKKIPQVKGNGNLEAEIGNSISEKLAPSTSDNAQISNSNSSDTGIPANSWSISNTLKRFFKRDRITDIINAGNTGTVSSTVSMLTGLISEMVSDLAGTDSLTNALVEDATENLSDSVNKRAANVRNRLDKRADFDSFLPISQKLGLNDVAEKELKAIYNAQVVVTNIPEIASAAVYFSKAISDHVPECAKTQFAIWANSTAESNGGTINRPTTDANGRLTIVTEQVNQPNTYDIPPSLLRKRQSDDANFGTIDPQKVLAASQQVVTDMENLAARIVHSIFLANPTWKGMNVNANFAFQAYVLGVLSRRLSDVVQVNMTTISGKIYQMKVNDIVGDTNAINAGSNALNAVAGVTGTTAIATATSTITSYTDTLTSGTTVLVTTTETTTSTSTTTTSTTTSTTSISTTSTTSTSTTDPPVTLTIASTLTTVVQKAKRTASPLDTDDNGVYQLLESMANIF